MRQPCRKHELHDEATKAEEEQIGPLAGTGGEPEADAWNGEKCDDADYSGTSGEIVHRDERVRAFTDPANRCVSACGAEDSDKSYAYAAETLS